MSEKNSFEEIQKKVNDWIINHGGYWPPLSMLSAVVEEVGEVAREINSLEGFKPKKSTEKIIDLGEELADLIYAIVCIANYYKIDLNKKIHEVLDKYKLRDAKRFKK